MNNDTRIRSGHAKILRGDEEWPRQCAQHCLLGLCTSLLGRRDEEELFFSLLYLILKVDILTMGPKKKERKRETALRQPHVRKFTITQLRYYALCSHDTCRILTTN